MDQRKRAPSGRSGPPGAGGGETFAEAPAPAVPVEVLDTVFEVGLMTTTLSTDSSLISARSLLKTMCRNSTAAARRKMWKTLRAALAPWQRPMSLPCSLTLVWSGVRALLAEALSPICLSADADSFLRREILTAVCWWAILFPCRYNYKYYKNYYEKNLSSYLLFVCIGEKYVVPTSYHGRSHIYPGVGSLLLHSGTR